MATAVFSHSLASASERPSVALSAAKRLVNAVVASRVEAAERELRRRPSFIHETALVQGDFRKIGLDKADLLPFVA